MHTSGYYWCVVNLNFCVIIYSNAMNMVGWSIVCSLLLRFIHMVLFEHKHVHYFIRVAPPMQIDHMRTTLPL